MPAHQPFREGRLAMRVHIETITSTFPGHLLDRQRDHVSTAPQPRGGAPKSLCLLVQYAKQHGAHVIGLRASTGLAHRFSDQAANGRLFAASEISHGRGILGNHRAGSFQHLIGIVQGEQVEASRAPADGFAPFELGQEILGGAARQDAVSDQADQVGNLARTSGKLVDRQRTRPGKAHDVIDDPVRRDFGDPLLRQAPAIAASNESAIAAFIGQNCRIGRSKAQVAMKPRNPSGRQLWQ